MAKRPDLDTQVKLSKAASVTQSTVWRILESKVGASIDVVDALAKAFGVPGIVLLSDAEEMRVMELWNKLDPGDREKVLAFMQVTISAGQATIQSQQKNYWMEEQPIQPSLRAASARAGARPPTGDDSRNDQPTTAQQQGKRNTS